MYAIGHAALEYLRQKGEAPRRLDDLVGAGFLYVDESEAGMAPPGRYNAVYAEDACQVQLSFPETANGYRLVDGTVISRSDHRPAVLVSCDRVSIELQDYANRLFAEEWYSIMATTEGD